MDGKRGDVLSKGLDSPKRDTIQVANMEREEKNIWDKEMREMEAAEIWNL